MSLWTLQRGEGPVIVNVPHAGTHVPMLLAPLLAPEARTLPDTDWHVEKLYAFAAEAGATLMCATHSRYVVDLNRDPSGAALYAGADNTEICPTRTFANAPVYAAGTTLTADDVGARVAGYFLPYHAALAAEVERVAAEMGRCGFDEVRVDGLGGGDGAEELGDLGVAFPLGLFGEGQVLAVGLRFTGERSQQVLFGLGPSEACHCLFSFHCTV